MDKKDSIMYYVLPLCGLYTYDMIFNRDIIDIVKNIELNLRYLSLLVNKKFRYVVLHGK